METVKKDETEHSNNLEYVRTNEGRNKNFKRNELKTKIEEDIEKHLKLLEINRGVLKIIENNIAQLDGKIHDLEKECVLKEDQRKPQLLQKEHVTQFPVMDSGKIQIVSDSHGRNLSNLIRNTSGFRVQSLIKPGAKSNNILDIDSQSTNTEESDFTILMIGANDVASNEAQSLLRTLKKYLTKNFHSDILLCTVPHRYDLSMKSIVNMEIMKTNSKIKQLCKVFKNVNILDISNLGRRFHTSNGQHFNVMGKRYITQRMIEIVRNGIANKSNNKKEVIPLEWHTQGNFY